jgi:uncharacterized membrane protein YciS (DUF1049 family)
VGWVLQIATLACALIVPMMLLVGLLFGALWLTVLVQGRKMDEHTSRVDAQWHAETERSATERSAAERSATERSAPERSAPETPTQDG